LTDVPAADAASPSPLLTLLVFNPELIEWFSMVVTEDRKLLERFSIFLTGYGLDCRIVDCRDGLGADGGDIAVDDAALVLPPDGDPFEGVHHGGPRHG